MFTGIVQDQGSVRRVERRGEFTLLVVATALPTHEFVIGESISVNGACQTVVRVEGGAFVVEVSPETLARTTLGKLRPGAKVNLERALRPLDRLGGHFVQGHVDGLGQVRRVDKTGQFIVVSVQIPAGLLPYVVEKGSVALDGVSLTVNRVDPAGFEVGLIPHTAGLTGLAGLRQGDMVNVETDLIAKYIERLLALRQGAQPSAVTIESLAEAGFLK